MTSQFLPGLRSNCADQVTSHRRDVGCLKTRRGLPEPYKGRKTPEENVYQVSPRKSERGTTTRDGQRCDETKCSGKLRLAIVSGGRFGLRRPVLCPPELRARGGALSSMLAPRPAILLGARRDSLGRRVSVPPQRIPARLRKVSAISRLDGALDRREIRSIGCTFWR
jgi:hypothetical protein